MPECGLGRGLYFGRPVVSEPHSGEPPRQFGEGCLPPCLELACKIGKPKRFAGACSPKRCVPWKKRHFGVFGRHQEACLAKVMPCCKVQDPMCRNRPTIGR